MLHTVKAHDAAETILAEGVDLETALDVHEQAGGHATIYGPDGAELCMVEAGIAGGAGACECRMCRARSTPTKNAPLDLLNAYAPPPYDAPLLLGTHTQPQVPLLRKDGTVDVGSLAPWARTLWNERNP